ncbi:very short patch repair endonuclease [Oceanicaulis sp. MMSF_3324]|uniref:very short patch repair endonuclease n=1 Tax=Oceanicaulis sp. MMSF_3324 TaxID=3046702 RepID=UPI00273ECFCE|nr:very short patch repair endonuclease [Oceanicaulis sp. MMSF_3324]
MVNPKGSDVFTPQDRARVMRAVKGKDTKPEMIVRRLAHAMGYRFRLHRKDLPGKPDLVFPGRKAVIFVHGCFWHGHDCARGSRQPKQNAEYWRTKIGRNVERDTDNLETLASQGWRTQVIWECEMKDRDALAERIRAFLD